MRAERLRSVLHVLYLLFNEGYASSSGPDLARADLSGEAIRLARRSRAALPDDPEVAGLLALMLLTDARRPARTGADGELIPLAEQDRTLWDRASSPRASTLITEALRHGPVGEYQVQAAIAAVHDQARELTPTPTGREILALYRLLERMTGNPMVTLNRAVATAMVDGSGAGLAVLDGLAERLGDHHRLHSVRAHLLELAGDTETRHRRVPGRRRPHREPPRAALPHDQGRPACRGDRPLTSGPLSPAGLWPADHSPGRPLASGPLSRPATGRQALSGSSSSSSQSVSASSAGVAPPSSRKATPISRATAPMSNASRCPLMNAVLVWCTRVGPLAPSRPATCMRRRCLAGAVRHLGR